MRLTKKQNTKLYPYIYSGIDDTFEGTPINKLGQLEDIEEELGIDLVTLFKALKNGFYFKDYQNNNEIRFSGNTFIRVGNQFVETKPCYEVKETTLYSCYNPLKYPSTSKKVEDAHFWSWKTHLHFRIDEYGKTWALTKEELEK